MGEGERLILAEPSPSVLTHLAPSADQRPMPDTHKLAIRYLDERRRTGQVTAATATDQRHVLRGFAEIAPRTSDVTRRGLLRWFDTQAHVAPGTRRNRFSVVRSFCRWLTARGHVKRDPCIEIPSPKVPRPARKTLTEDQAAALVAECQDVTDLLILALGFDLGLRRAEQAGLEVGDLTLGPQPTLMVRKSKGGHVRCLPIPATTYSVLTRYLDTRKVTAGPLIRLRKYPERGVQPVWIGRRFSELSYRAGVKTGPRDGISHHGMRRTLATNLWLATGDAPLVAEVLGHEGLASLKHYVNAANLERMRNALNQL